MSKTGWLRVLVGGALWAAVYNSVWGIAWFTFMRQEWLRATASIDQALPWTPHFWAVWIPMTIPLGVAIMAYLASRPKCTAIPRAVLAASLVLWVPGTVGMAAWAWQESLPAHIIALDSSVDLVAVIVASFVGSWSLRAHAMGATDDHPANALQ